MQVSFYDGVTCLLIISYFSIRFGNGNEIDQVMHHMNGQTTHKMERIGRKGKVTSLADVGV